MNATYLFRNFTITDPVSNFNLQTLDILVIDGIIAQIGSIEPSVDYQLIEGNGDCV
jgi:predicted amidohydrolase